MTNTCVISLNVHEAKTHLSRYLAKIAAGWKVIVCRNGVPVAQLTALDAADRPATQRFGLGVGKGKLTKSFFQPLTADELPDLGL